MNALDALGIAYRRYEHAPVETMEDCARIGAGEGARHFKNLFLTNRQGNAFYLVMLDVKKRFRTAQVSRLLGVSRLSFASPEILMEKLSVSPGAVTPLGLIYDSSRSVSVVVDEDIMKAQYVLVHPCVSTASLLITTEDLFRFLSWCGNAVRRIRLDA